MDQSRKSKFHKRTAGRPLGSPPPERAATVELLLTAWKKAAAGSPSQAALRVDIDARFDWNNAKGWTAFSVAAFCGHADVIELLRRNGANPLLGTSHHEDGLALVGGPAQQARPRRRRAGGGERAAGRP